MNENQQGIHHHDLMRTLQEREVLISDGAWGTLLQEQGLPPGVSPESWNLDHPDQVESIAKAYIQAGSELIGTNSFGGNRYKLEHYGLEHQVREINQAAAQLSRKAAGEDHFVIGSMGPTGKMLLMGDITEEQLYDAFSEQAVSLDSGGVDALCIETMTALDEALIAIKAASENTDLVLIATMTFDKTRQGTYRTMMGVSPEEMVDAFTRYGVDIVGTNCGNGMENMVGIVKAIRKVNNSIPVLVHANAGMPHLENGKNVFDEKPSTTASFIPRILEAGAKIVGGCCGTTPDHIRQIKKQVELFYSA